RTSVSDLPPELVCLIGSRLHTAINVVRFHAVCSDWRQSLRHIPPSPPPAAALLPWHLAPSSGDDADAAAGVACRCVFSKTSYHAPGLCFRDRRVAHADGTASWFINDKLVNPLTGWINVGRVKKYPWMWRWEEQEEDAAARANLQRLHRHQQRDLRIHVGDLSPKVDSLQLREMYSEHGKVVRARVAYDKRGRSRGFGLISRWICNLIPVGQILLPTRDFPTGTTKTALMRRTQRATVPSCRRIC
uniref:RRM domain-containing protein n=1 Tax=Oryza glaberrima TaxID=4538 RepID=I1NZ92_ORYGL